MAYRKRHRGTTKQRGYGHHHQAERRRRIRTAHYTGAYCTDPCAICGHPLGYWAMDLAHDHTNGGYLPGLAHAHCNRAEGAARGNRMRGPAQTWAAARRW